VRKSKKRSIHGMRFSIKKTALESVKVVKLYKKFWFCSFFNNYTKIISLGNNCSVGTTLRKLKFKDASYPFDWNNFCGQKVSSIHVCALLIFDTRDSSRVFL
jgi:hypothetical protein